MFFNLRERLYGRVQSISSARNLSNLSLATKSTRTNVQSFNDRAIFTIEELNELSFHVKPHISALHLNMRSLSKHFNGLCNPLESISLSFDLIACSETWITPQVDIEHLKIPGYNMLIDNHMFPTGGGVG